MPWIKVIGGDIGKGKYIFNKGGWGAAPSMQGDPSTIIGAFKVINLGKSDVHRYEAIDSVAEGMGNSPDNKFDAYMAISTGKNRNVITFAAYLKNGKKFMAETDSDTYKKMLAAIF